LGRELAGVVSRLVLVGPMGKTTATAAIGAGLSTSSVYWFESSGQARDALFDLVRSGDTILVKGSRAMAMELVSQEIANHYGQETHRPGRAD
jgi:UDP-N-acetylmuramoyl-tripeptide--D-alanyl-D-alanine ligase